MGKWKVSLPILFSDTTILFMAGFKDSWSDLVQDRTTDLFSISTEDTEEGLRPINDVVSRMKRGKENKYLNVDSFSTYINERIIIVNFVVVPKRLFNSQCGSDYVPYGRVNSHDDYILPNGTNFYRLHPNYFFNRENKTLIKVSFLLNIIIPCVLPRILHIHMHIHSVNLRNNFLLNEACYS